jgi:hypothetical protein
MPRKMTQQDIINKFWRHVWNWPPNECWGFNGWHNYKGYRFSGTAPMGLLEQVDSFTNLLRVRYLSACKLTIYADNGGA